MARGVLRVYLGAAPGVGKTFAMLDEGWRGKQRGRDVVVGYVETHSRPKTEAQIRDLEVVPRRTLTYRGQSFEEMDVDAVLRRHPEQVLVDELAHTNIPGSRHAKRWQDVAELLDAGIGVITTVNIQHLESLNDVVQQITGIEQRETVPDSVVRSADQIELVDMSPEALRRRMAHGNIYAADKVDAALANYFRVGNLGALRELALLWVADRVDETLHDYRERHGIAEPWETKERVVVALTGSPAGADLVRRAARMAMRSKGELVGVHIQSGDGLAGPGLDALETHRELLESLGGRYREVVGTDVAAALIQVARAENATQIVLGSSNRTRITELLRGSVINRVIRQSGRAIDVHVISGARPTDTTPGPPPVRHLRLTPLPPRREAVGFALALVVPVLLTVALTPVRENIGLHNAILSFLLLVVIVSTVGGLRPALVACLLAFGLINWFFIPPIHTFTIDSGRDLFALFAFLAVAGAVSTLVDLSARGRLEASRARSDAQALARMADLILRERDPLPALLADLVATLRLDGAAVLRPGASGWSTEIAAGPNPPAVLTDGVRTIALTDDSSLVLRASHIRADDEELLAAFTTQLRLALESRRLHTEASTAEALTKTNELRTAILAAVSHDLRTPLASIKTAATGLLSDDLDLGPGDARELLITIDAEVDRLNTLVGNLLDMSRLQTGGLVIDREPVALEDTVALAMRSLPDGRRVDADVPESAPRVLADAGLLERVVANLLANALAYSVDEHVQVRVDEVGDRVELRVIDRGRGIPVAERDRVFQPFQRLGDNPNGEGVGLGLAVARGFVEAMGGTLTIDESASGGCTMVVSLPRAER